ncbi:NAD-glutamate dehydrogenase [Neptuniibacter caesariensis]|uniref:NAD-glutamate dehydrogenase n=1 Tax=Neptuniibacter caesariensis TaxID=207954 RepID=A0A7U8C4M3_NEPCE|nr:NAD-glutamate dehydrogenase [Neptuniibacter caesariensis]EAR59826.1 NAD-glutamate dehydrogenase [Neptuniibacter caesariensis]
MAKWDQDEKSSLLSALCNELQTRLPEDRAADLVEFATLYYASASEVDLLEWKLEDLYGSTIACWQFIQSRKRAQAKVRVFNPDYEQHGWQSTHTIIEVLQEDMPFLVDSLRMELNRRNLTIHAIHNAVVSMKRDDKGGLIQVLKKDSRAKHSHPESLVSIEVDRHTDEVELKELEHALLNVLEDVSMVVEDFDPMLEKCDSLAGHFSKTIKGYDKSVISEVHDFIAWLKDHFTFLGYDEYKLNDKNGKPVLEAVPGSQLGLLRFCDEHCRSALVNDNDRDAEGFVLIPDVLSFTKSSRESSVHRPIYPDYISIKQFNSKGEVVGECRFLGLYTSSVYIQSSRQIPVVRRKVEAIMEKSGLHRYGHDWKELLQILEIHPRDDLFQVSVEDLYKTVLGVLQIHERRQIRLFVRKDYFGQFYSCLVYSPRDIYSTDFRHKVQAQLMDQLNCDKADFTTYFSESILTRTQFILRGDNIAEDFDPVKLERLVRMAARSWRDDLQDALIETLGEEQGIRTFNLYGDGFPASYSADFSARTAVVDLQHIRKLTEQSPLQLSFYQALERDQASLNFKLFSLGASLPLSDVIPVLENLGLRVIDEHPYRISSKSQGVWIHDFNLQYTGVGSVSLQTLKAVFEDAFLNIWRGEAASDEFNRLVLAAQMGWREVAMLRAYAAYMKQMRFAISQEAVSNTLNSYVNIAALLVELFEARFKPKSKAQAQGIEEQIIASLDDVSGLNDDRVIRQYLALMNATLRTNFYQSQPNGDLKNYFSFKLSPDLIPDMPLPRPKFEIFVFSPRVEGVHLRGGKVARGGLRWSDRIEDFRTEVLGLVKAQQVKNAVIVPVGAKGGFVAKLLNDSMSREQWLEEGIACYKTFISGLLDITDNLVEGEVIPPPLVVRRDEDDTYLVVAADKGTATFSDIANEIAEDYGFWLGDAFASGGSQGYDHKKMGITARGAWVSVERHFREMGLNTDKDDFTVIGIGDMSGDVFGNGMLLSKHICLVAAFNHMHIFIDPTPNPAKSWNERQRLFDLPRSAWTDYDEKLISKGGGVFSRNAKSIELTPEIQALTGLKAKSVNPNELISALLKAQVDLIWNGGIGTYVKASDETDADIGDKANDALRINGQELRCKVVGEGGNLGLSQKARMEYTLNGGRMNTDFIDNAGGVDCSDHEVNIKILLNQIVADGDMTQKQRNRLLEDMTDDVAGLVLQNNYRQVQAISMAESRSAESMAEYQRYISNMESAGKLDRDLEFLPADEALNERRSSNKGLTRPELSVLISYSKAELKEALTRSAVPDDAYLSNELYTAFPENLLSDFGSQLSSHRLRREIIGTQIANHMINMMGINFVDRLRISTGADDAVIARAYMLARDVFDVEEQWLQIEKLDHKVASELQVEMMHELQHLMRRATRWFVRNRRAELDCAKEVAFFREHLGKLVSKQENLFSGEPLERWHKAKQRYQEAGVPAKLAKLVAGARCLYASLGIIEVAAVSEISADKVAKIYFGLGERLELDWLSKKLNKLSVDNYWQALAREAFRDDLDWQQRAVVDNAIQSRGKGSDVTAIIDKWCSDNDWLLERWQNVLTELKSAKKQEYAMYTVALRELFDLAKTSQFSR